MKIFIFILSLGYCLLLLKPTLLAKEVKEPLTKQQSKLSHTSKEMPLLKEEKTNVIKPLDASKVYFFSSSAVRIGYSILNVKLRFHNKKISSSNILFLPHFPKKNPPIVSIGYRFKTWDLAFANGTINVPLNANYTFNNQIYKSLSLSLTNLSITKLWTIIQNRLSFYNGISYLHSTRQLTGLKSSSSYSLSQAAIKVGLRLYTNHHLLLQYGYSQTLFKDKLEWVNIGISLFIPL